MGVIIKAVGVSDCCGESSIENAVQAAQRCLEQAAISGHHVDLLINVGVYRDDNIMEPSIAALIQQKLQLNPDPVKNDIHSRTFSFDLMNGACGLLNAVDVAASFMSAGVYQHVLVVGGDIHPSRRAVEGFPFSSAGGAVLLGYSNDPAVGFGKIAAHSVMDNDFFGYYGKGALKDFGTTGRQHAIVTLQPEYKDHFCHALRDSAQRFLLDQKMPLEKIDSLVTSQLETGFPQQLAASLELSASVMVPDIHEQWGDPHTAAPMMCVYEMIRQGALTPGSQVLFALAGSGITTTCGLYRVPA